MSGVVCRWCGKQRGVVYVDTPNRGPWGFLFCPGCDRANDPGPPSRCGHTPTGFRPGVLDCVRDTHGPDVAHLYQRDRP